MLNFVYWPISAILWFWHKASGFLFDPSSGISWVLAIILLVVTIRILLFKPMLNRRRGWTKSVLTMRTSAVSPRSTI